VVLILVTIAICAGCSGGDKAENQAAETTTLTAEQSKMINQAATIANAIALAPQTMAKVLADHKLTADEYKTLIYKISADPELSKAYKDARKR